MTSKTFWEVAQCYTALLPLGKPLRNSFSISAYLVRSYQYYLQVGHNLLKMIFVCLEILYHSDSVTLHLMMWVYLVTLLFLFYKMIIILWRSLASAEIKSEKCRNIICITLIILTLHYCYSKTEQVLKSSHTGILFPLALCNLFELICSNTHLLFIRF